MAAALLRRGLCVRCIHRELCRVVWRPQTALFSSKPSDRKQPRRTHIKKAKPQPALDVAKLLEQLFSQRRPGAAPPPVKARPAKASSMLSKPLTTSSIKVSTSNVPTLSKTEPAVPLSPAASSMKQTDGVPKKTFNTAPPSPQPKSASPTNPKTSYSSETPQQSPLDVIQGFAADRVSSVTSTTSGSAAAAIETIETSVETAAEPVELKTATVLPSSAHMVEKNVEMSSFTAATVESLIETTTESPVEQTLEVRAAVVGGLAEPVVDASAAEVQTIGTDSVVVDVSPVEASHFPMETLESRAAVVEGPVEPTIDVTVDLAAETKSTNSGADDISHAATVELSLESAVEPSVEARSSPPETLESRAAVVECPVELKVDAPAQSVQTNSTISGPVNLSHIGEEQPLVETTIETSVESSTSLLETLESRAVVAEVSAETTIETEADTAAQAVETNSTDSGVVNAKGEPLIEPAVEASTSPSESRAAASEGTVEPTIENKAADNLSRATLIQKAEESTPLALKNEVESSSGNVSVEDGVNKSEQMTLESVTLHDVQVLVESLKTDELLQTKSVLDERAEKRLQELSGTEAERKAAAETENSSEDESEILTKALSKWDSLPEDLQELEGESGMLVEELLCHVPAVLSKTAGTVETSSASDPPVRANGECLQMEEKGSEAEAMTLESITLAKVKAEVGGLETDVLLETRNALEKEAEVLVKEEKMEVEDAIEDVALLEDTTEAEVLTLDSISEVTDVIEAETSVILEAMFGSEQGPRQPQDETIDREAERESGEQGGGVLEAMTVESVTLAEVEASMGALEGESLSETSDYLEKEAEILARETRTEVEDGVVFEETTEALRVESLSLPEVDALSEALQTDALMEELLFSVPGHVTGSQIGQEAARVNNLDATVVAESVDVDAAAAVTDHFQASPALKEVLLGQEAEEEDAQTEALGSEDGKGTQRDLDPVQRLFLEKIREYNIMRRLNGGPLKVEPEYEKYLSEETAKLQRLYGGGDLSSFPEFTFTGPKLDQDSK